MSGEAGPLNGVSPRLGLGTAGFKPGRRERAFAVLDAWAELGGRLIDTAAVYAGGESERVIGEWLRSAGTRDGVVLLTKGGHPDIPSWRSRLDPQSIAADLAQSLDRLGVEAVDLYLLHRDDLAVPVAEIIEALNVHLAAGRVRSIGASNWSPARVDEANAYATRRGLSGFAVVSNYFGLARPVRTFWPGTLDGSGQDFRAWHTRTGLPLVAWSAQSGGYFADDFDLSAKGTEPVETFDGPINRERRARAVELAASRGLRASQVALAWVLNQPIAPYALVGTRTPEHLREAWQASKVVLTAAELAWLEAGTGT